MIRSLLEPRYPHLRGFRPVYREFRAGDVRLSQADIGKAKRLLGYQPVWRIGEGLKRTIDWNAARLAPQHAIDGRVPEPQVARHRS
jgi:UDP-N-acetylglucosamine 4-epimerase